MADELKEAIEYFTKYLDTAALLKGPLRGEPACVAHYRVALAALTRQSEQATTRDGVCIVPGSTHWLPFPLRREIKVASITTDEHTCFVTDSTGKNRDPNDLHSTLPTKETP